jgi:FkbM family methyltransferase
MKSVAMAFLRCWRTALMLTGRDVYYPVQCICTKEHHGTLLEGYSLASERISCESVIYSLGVGDDISFDLSIMRKFGVQVHAFDPTPRAIQWIESQKLPKGFHFYNFGVSDFDGYAQLNPHENPRDVSHTILDRPETTHNGVKVKVHSLRTIVDMLGHRKIDVLKMDIEGAEYGVIQDIVSSDIEIDQLLLEFHHRFRNVGTAKTRHAIEALNNRGFKIFDVSPNEGVYSFIHN